FLFSALALAVVLSLFASYVVALTVVPLFCAKLLKSHAAHEPHRNAENAGETPRAEEKRKGFGQRFNDWFNRRFGKLLDGYGYAVGKALNWPRMVVFELLGLFALSLSIYPLLGVAFFPRTDAPVRGQRKSAFGHAAGSDRGRGEKGRGDYPPGGVERRSGDDRLERRCDAGILLDLHQQLRPAHCIRASESDRRASRGQL